MDLKLRITIFVVSLGGHRGLHSFPTRRSSDLTRKETFCIAPRGGWMRTRTRTDRPRRTLRGAEALRIVAKRRPWSSRSVARIRDRKSTRLNSSHSQNSYAVFCLKNKIRVDLS